MKKPYAISRERLNTLPEEIVTKLMDTLKCFDKVYVDYNWGKYSYSTGIGITKTYAPDHEMIGIVYADDVYTAEERKEHRKEMDKYSYGD